MNTKPTAVYLMQHKYVSSRGFILAMGDDGSLSTPHTNRPTAGCGVFFILPPEITHLLKFPYMSSHKVLSQHPRHRYISQQQPSVIPVS